ncbi:uncharacterized protein EV420DRAFT_1485131 [Desarmillaria tabescens]|uniref:Uncharacterized protein n=1 Tax=Armillaria tabescens TaxID=1929756 RepID=A0AA39JJR7_ARMTA|nr:uncharacterized protein EV420DRAFT_1485131 [Desarmillaria tabescens]KAK0443021.1 hypothetical protein EV420DRAFT_1485131 [Desarmillaria tabescens]
MASLSKLLDSSTRFDLSTSVWIRNVTLESGVRGLSGLIVWFWSSRRIDIPSPFAEVVSLSSAEDKEQLMPSSASVTTTSRLTTASPTSTLIERGYETTFDFVKGVYVDNGGRHSRRVVRAGSVPRDVKRPKGWWEGIHYRFVITYKHSPVHSTTALVQTGIRDSHYTITFILWNAYLLWCLHAREAGEKSENHEGHRAQGSSSPYSLLHRHRRIRPQFPGVLHIDVTGVLCYRPGPLLRSKPHRCRTMPATDKRILLETDASSLVPANVYGALEPKQSRFPFSLDVTREGARTVYGV